MFGLVVERQGEGAVARLHLRNTGARAGSTVVQLYLGDDAASVPRPARELKGFAKVTLDPGAETEVVLPLPPRAFCFFDTPAQCWRREAGGFTLWAGFSAADIRATATLDFAEGITLPV
jgi:beta-glucosidase